MKMYHLFNIRSVVYFKKSFTNSCYHDNKLFFSSSINNLSTGTSFTSPKYRIPISLCYKMIENNSDYNSFIHDNFCIPPNKWLAYLEGYRRKFIKHPSSCISSDEITSLTENLNKLSIIKRIETIQGDYNLDTESLSEPDIFLIKTCESIIYKNLIKSAEIDLHSAISIFKVLKATSDLRLPHEWYPYARLMKRKIYYHGGPTNSGKTYQALQRLRSAEPEKGGGIFCGPLRLLALEVYEKLSREGVYSNLLTGQEKRYTPFATHVSCTVEIADLDKNYDVAVIDEIQMIADPSRGWAWTRALLGLRANEIHLCGGLEALELVQSILKSTGDEFVVCKYERLSTLRVAKESLRGDYSKVRPGDCVVAFTKADIFSIKNEIERLTNFKCAVIYGQLPPEVRSLQARLFNEGIEYDILVASDAIGMGLNLNIGRIIFNTVRKRNGVSGTSQRLSRWIEPSNIKQIAGRAGRLSSKFKYGEVTTWQEVDLPYVHAVMSWNIPSVASAGVFPTIEVIQQFSYSMIKSFEDDIPTTGDVSEDMSNLPNNQTNQSTNSLIVKDLSLSIIMTKFKELSNMDHRYFMCNFEDLNLVSNWLHPIPMSIVDRFVFASAPVNTRNSWSMNALYDFAAKYVQNRPIPLHIRLKQSPPQDFSEFEALCTHHNVLELYLWLSLRFPKYFIERDICLEQKELAMKMIQESLNSGRIRQNYSHSLDYLKEYQSSLKHEPNFLPPLEYGEIREKTKEHMEKLSTKPTIQFRKSISMNLLNSSDIKQTNVTSMHQHVGESLQ